MQMSERPDSSLVDTQRSKTTPQVEVNSGPANKSSEETPDHLLTASPGGSGIDLVSEDIVALSGRSSLNMVTMHQVSVFELFPRVTLMSSGPADGSTGPLLSMKNRPRLPLQSWYESMLNRGFNCLVFETNGSPTELLSHCRELFKGQFLVFPKTQSSCSLDPILATACAFSFWHLLDRRDSIAVFDLESLNPVSLAACLLVADLSKTPEDVCEKISEIVVGLRWKPSEIRYLQYMSKLIKTDASTIRPRPIMVKQILIDSCFCAEKDLEIIISDASQTEASNKHVTQFYDDETQSIAVHFPQMKLFLFQGDVAVTIRSQSIGASIIYRFNSGFIDNLTSSVINCGASQWDNESGATVLPQFNVQIITVPATNTTSTPIVVPPYACVGDRIKGREFFAAHHIMRPNEHLMDHFRNNNSAFSDLEVQIALEVTENNYLDSTMFLYKYFAADNPKNSEDMFLLCKLPSPGISRSPSIDDGILHDAKSFASGASRFSRRTAGAVYTRGASMRGDNSPAGSVRSVASRRSSVRSQVGQPVLAEGHLKPLEPVRITGQRSSNSSSRRYAFGRGAETATPEVKIPESPPPKEVSLPIILESPVSVKAVVESPKPLHMQAFTHANVESPPKPVEATPAGRPSVSRPDELITPSPVGEAPTASRSGVRKATPPMLPKMSPPYLLKHSVTSPVYSPESPPQFSPGSRVASPGSRKSFMTNLFGGQQSPLSRQNATSPIRSVPSSPIPVAAGKPAGEEPPAPPPQRPSLGKAGPPGLPPQVLLGKASPPAIPGLASLSPPVPGRKAGGPPVPMGMPKAPPLPVLLTESLEEPAELPLGRRLHWKPLRNVDDTIWADMAEDSGEDFTALKSVFEESAAGAPKEASQSLPTTTRRGSIGGNEAKIITLLESKRAQNIGVVLARVRIEIVTLRLMSLETDSVSVEDLERLKTVLPTDEEVQCFTQFKGQVSNLRDIEQKVFELFRMPRLSQRIMFCITFLNLPGQIEEILREIMLLRKGSWEIRCSTKLKKILFYVLQMGNYVNGRKTKGFSVESLSKLMEFKSASDPSITSLHFLAVKLMTSDQSLVDITDELPSLKSAARVAFDGLMAAVHAAKSEPQAFSRELANFASSYTENCIERMKSFVDTMAITITALTEEWDQCEKELVELRKFFGEDPRKVSSDEFINHLKLFLDNLSNTCADLKKRPKKFEKILQAMQNQPMVAKPQTPASQIDSKWSVVRKSVLPKQSPSRVSSSWDTVLKALSPRASPVHAPALSPSTSPSRLVGLASPKAPPAGSLESPKAIPVSIPKTPNLRPISERQIDRPAAPFFMDKKQLPSSPTGTVKKWSVPDPSSPSSPVKRWASLRSVALPKAVPPPAKQAVLSPPVMTGKSATPVVEQAEIPKLAAPEAEVKSPVATFKPVFQRVVSALVEVSSPVVPAPREITKVPAVIAPPPTLRPVTQGSSSVTSNVPPVKPVSPVTESESPAPPATVKSPPLVKAEVVTSPAPESPRLEGWKMSPRDPKAKSIAPNWVTLPDSPQSKLDSPTAYPKISAETHGRS